MLPSQLSDIIQPLLQLLPGSTVFPCLAIEDQAYGMQTAMMLSGGVGAGQA